MTTRVDSTVKDAPNKGLKAMRSQSGSVRQKCSNCGCERYATCTCQKKGEKRAS